MLAAYSEMSSLNRSDHEISNASAIYATNPLTVYPSSSPTDVSKTTTSTGSTDQTTTATSTTTATEESPNSPSETVTFPLSSCSQSLFGRLWRICTLNFLCEVLVADGDEAGGERLKQMYELLGLISALLVGISISPTLDMHNWLVPADDPGLSESRPVAIAAVIALFCVMGFSIFNIMYVTVITVYLNVIAADELQSEVTNLPVWGIPILAFVGTILAAFIWVCLYLFIQFPFYALPIAIWFGTVMTLFFSLQFYLFVFRLPQKMEQQWLRKQYKAQEKEQNNTDPFRSSRMTSDSSNLSTPKAAWSGGGQWNEYPGKYSSSPSNGHIPVHDTYRFSRSKSRLDQ